MIKAVIDTNILVSALSSKSKHHWLIQSILNQQFDLYVTDEILLEYEEVLNTKYSEAVATNFLVALKELPNVYFAHIYFRWNLITNDPDDNKFVDCYLASGGEYLVSHDTDFAILAKIAFPKIKVVKIDEFEPVIVAGK